MRKRFPHSLNFSFSEFRAIKIDETQAKKLKAEPKDEVDVAKESALEETIKKQSKQLYKIRDALKEKCKKTELQDILFKNGSGMVAGIDGLLDRAADLLTFGALIKCQKCKKGDLMFAKFGYKCNGMLDEWTACDSFETKPLRKKCKLPSELVKREDDDFFARYKSKVEDRVVRSAPPVIKSKKEELREAKVKREREPLYNMHVVALGLSTPKEELKQRIQKMGGKLVTKIQSMIAVVISNKEEVEKMNKRMQEVKEFDIQVS